MLILTIRTDKPEAEIGLYNDHKQLGYQSWEAHRQLAETLHIQIRTLLTDVNKTWTDIDGIVYYKGPGSFTGLRIGASLANALASSCEASVVSANGDDWIAQAIDQLLDNSPKRFVAPEYGQGPHITQPKK